MTITELEKKYKNGTITPGEKVLLKVKKQIEKEKQEGVVYFCGGNSVLDDLKQPLKMDF